MVTLLKKIIRSLLGFGRKRVPVILQLNEQECGLACIAMILSYFSYKTTLAECRRNVELYRDGISAQMLVEIIKTYGLAVKAYSIEPYQLDQVTLPAIAHWEFNHFIIIEHQIDKEISIVDPGIGRRTLTLEEFSNGFTGVILTFSKTADFKPQRTQRKQKPYLRDYAFAHPRITLQLLALSLFSQFLLLVIPISTKILVDDVVTFGSIDLLAVVGIAIVLTFFTQFLIELVRSFLLVYFRAKLESQMITNFFSHMLDLPMNFFLLRGRGDLLNRVYSLADIRNIFSEYIISLVLDSSFVVIYFAILLLSSMSYTLLVVFFSVIQVVLVVLFNHRIHTLTRESLVKEAKSNSYLIDSISGIPTLKSLGAENHALQTWQNLMHNALNNTINRGYLTALMVVSASLVKNITTLSLLAFGIYQVINRNWTLGEMLALNAVALGIQIPLNSFLNNMKHFYLLSAHTERVVEVMEFAPEQQVTEKKMAHRISGSIHVEHLSFSYGASKTLTDVSLNIEAGQKVAIVGQSGSGKSTLLKVLLGLLPSTAGRVFFDGRDISLMDYKTLRQQLGVVLQEPFLFNGSILENITFGIVSYTMDDVIHTAKLAEIHDDIIAMPMQYETNISENGVALSGGQRQRVAIARALLRQPNLLVMDEATSNLDAVLENAIYQNLRGLQTTQIVVAHRLSTIYDADQIILLKGGRIEAIGNHQELLSSSDYYRFLTSNQLVKFQL